MAASFIKIGRFELITIFRYYVKIIINIPKFAFLNYTSIKGANNAKEGFDSFFSYCSNGCWGYIFRSANEIQQA